MPLRPHLHCALLALAACTGKPAQVVPAAAAEPAPVAPAVAATPPIAAPPTPSPEPTPEPAEPPPADPLSADAQPLDPADEPLRRALGDGAPEAVEIVATHAMGRERLVLARVRDDVRWQHRQDPDTVVATLERMTDEAEACETGGGTLDVTCALPIARGDLHLAWSLLGVDVFAWEVVRLRPAGIGSYSVAARRRLFPASRVPETAEPPKFKVYDVDLDRRSELTVIVPVDDPTGDAMEQITGEVGFILDATDLREQFAATRRHTYSYEDVSRSDSEAETVWLAKDLDADGHPDLQVRETVRERQSGGEDDEGPPTRRSTTRTTTCPYDQARDVWTCPEALGRQLLPRPAPAP